MNEEDVLRLITAGEGQTIEFKESLSRGSQIEGAQSLVAFANGDGGRVLFGVRDDRTLRGASLGAATLENLANFIMSRTYPSLPVHIQAVPVAGLFVVVVEAPGDRPPVIGLYLYSPNPLPLKEAVPTRQLVAFRRVGRTNQSTDLMWLRLDMPTDPRLRINITDRWVGIEEGIGETLTGRVWVEQDSASAHEISFRTEPAVFVGDQSLDDLPVPYESGGSRWGIRRMAMDSPPPPARVYGWETFEDFVMRRDPKVSDSDYSLIATYRDDLGLLWESRRSIAHDVTPSTNGEPRRLRRRGDFARRITAFPAKRTLES
jgi:hypothetical protein